MFAHDPDFRASLTTRCSGARRSATPRFIIWGARPRREIGRLQPQSSRRAIRLSLSTRRSHHLHAFEKYPLDARLPGSFRLSLGPLCQARVLAVEKELVAWASGTQPDRSTEPDAPDGPASKCRRNWRRAARARPMSSCSKNDPEAAVAFLRADRADSPQSLSGEIASPVRRQAGFIPDDGPAPLHRLPRRSWAARGKE